jgi:protein-disulfide isomerase
MKHILTNTKLFIVLGLLAFLVGCPGTSNNSNKTAPNAPKTATTPGIPANAPVGATPPNILGSATALVAVEEFADFQCPTCAEVHKTMKNVQAAYGSRIKFIYRNFPLTQIHKNSYDAAVAAEAAGQQGKFWDMQNQLFSNQTAWSNSTNAREIFEGYAQNIGIDVEKFKTDMLGMATKSRVDADIQRGRALNITSTPTVYINGVSVPFEQMNIDALKQLIDAQLQKTGTQTQSAPPATSSSAVANSANTSVNKTVSNSEK